MKEAELGKEYSDGDVVFRENDRAHCMYAIHAGGVRISKAVENREVTIAELKEGDVFGEMALFGAKVHPFAARAMGHTHLISIDKKKLFSVVARDASLAMRLLETLSNRIQQLSRSFAEFKDSYLSALDSSMGVDETCTQVLHAIRTHLPVENGSIMVLDEARTRLTVRYAFGGKPTEKERLTLGVGEGIAGMVVQTGEAQLVEDVTQNRLFKKGGQLPIRTLICVPVVCGGKSYGVINVSCFSPGSLTMEDLALLNSLSLSVALAFKREEERKSLESRTRRLFAEISQAQV